MSNSSNKDSSNETISRVNQTKTKLSEKTQRGLTHSSYNPAEPIKEDMLYQLKSTWQERFGWDVKELDESRYLTRKGLIEEINNFEPPKYKEVALKWMYERGIMPLISYPQEKGNIVVLGIKSELPKDSLGHQTIDQITVEQYVNTIEQCVSEAIQMIFTPEDKEKEFKYLLLQPDEFNEMTKLVNNKPERNIYLGELNPEDRAKQNLLALVKQAAIEGYSDIHIEPIFPNIARIRVRRDGVLKELGSSLVNESLTHFVGYIKNKARMDPTESRRPQDGSIIFSDEEFSGRDSYLKSYSLRVSTVPLNIGEKLVMRVLYSQPGQFNLNELGFSDEIKDRIKKLIKLPQGLILVTGPTGSGKTTTLYSILEELNTERVNVMTIENPIEINLQGINQSNTQEKIGWDYPHVLEKYLRQDPDIILIGEVRNQESAQITLEAAKTGHLVFSTVHANDSVRTLMRMKDFNVLRSDLYDSFAGVISQRLIQKLCHCSKESTYNAKSQLEDLLDEKLPLPITLHNPSGKKDKKDCQYCEGQGYKGRIPILEVWILGDKEKELIAKGEDSPELFMKTAIEGGMKPMIVYGFEKVLNGETSLEELLRIIPHTEFSKRKKLIIDSIKKHYETHESAQRR